MEITQEELIERALIQSERRYRSLIEKAYVAVLLIDKYQTISFASASVKNIIGLSPNQLLSKNIFEILSSQNENEFYTAIRDCKLNCVR